MSNQSILGLRIKKMKKQLIIIGIIILLVSVWLSGCEVIEENNYVIVTVDASVSIRLLDKNGAEVLNKNLSGIPIIIEMVKAGGERLRFERISSFGGADAQGTFHLYKEQMIEVIASVQGGFEDFYQLQAGYAVLPWVTVSEDVDLGESYYWETFVDITMENSTNY